MADSVLSDSELETILEKIRYLRNVDFRNYKRATLRRRTERRITERHVHSAAEYITLLDREPRELDTLISSMFIKATRFFRDDDVWRFLAQSVLPDIIASKSSTRTLRIWCAGCATGEEVFSIAILIAEALGSAITNWDVKIFGTDVDESAIAYARRATYSAPQVEGVPSELLDRWFISAPEGFTVRKEIRRLVVFGVNNLVTDAPISRLDLAFCRNVFIYLDSELQRRVIMRLHYAIRREGVLVLGRSELIPFAAKLFHPLDLSRRVYRKDDREEASLSAQPSYSIVVPPDMTGAVESSQEDVLPQLLQDVLNSMPLPVITTGLDGDVKLWNAEAARIWNRSSKDVLGKKLSALGLSGFSGDLLIEKSTEVREGRKARESTDGVIAVAGHSEPMIANIQVCPLRNSYNRTVGLLYAVQDATAIRALEKKLHQMDAERKAGNEKLQSTNEALQAANEELETTNEELQSANEELQTTNEELQSANEELETTNEELQSTNVELDATNRELAHRTEEMNALSFNQRTIIRSLSAAVVVMDGQGRVALWNVAAERFLGLTEAEAVGQIFWILRIPAFRRPTVLRIRKALREGTSFRVDEMPYDLPTGGRGFANVASLPMIEGKSNMGAVIIFEDITRFVKIAERRLREKLQSADRLKPVKAGRAKLLNDGGSEAKAAPSPRGVRDGAPERSKRVMTKGISKPVTSEQVSSKRRGNKAPS